MEVDHNHSVKIERTNAPITNINRSTNGPLMSPMGFVLCKVCEWLKPPFPGLLPLIAHYIMLGWIF